MSAIGRGGHFTRNKRAQGRIFPSLATNGARGTIEGATFRFMLSAVNPLNVKTAASNREGFS